MKAFESFDWFTFMYQMVLVYRKHERQGQKKQASEICTIFLPDAAELFVLQSLSDDGPTYLFLLILFQFLVPSCSTTARYSDVRLKYGERKHALLWPCHAV